jgi:hypothetical protein
MLFIGYKLGNCTDWIKLINVWNWESKIKILNLSIFAIIRSMLNQ